MNTFDVTMSEKARFELIWRGVNVRSILRSMQDWCVHNSDKWTCDLDLELLDVPIARRAMVAEALRAIGFEITFSFEEELDALAFRSMFSDYL
ncbi:hypothetical protein [Burkholderia vietnamiensis]|uniref:Uncharacterized protein n=1 Tax=Burkholderia vietnamiensis TaxID=60552 RepID=A0AAW7T873_BURVI|nr:hypothetical protein [Burkholderia vietnamiensis]MDN7798319.1 hypothetical protein [Burkholderia vietnamiensis]